MYQNDSLCIQFHSFCTFCQLQVLLFTEWHDVELKDSCEKKNRMDLLHKKSFVRSIRHVLHVFVSDRARLGSKTIREYVQQVA